ncbi:MAG: hypothetical protein HY841_13355 [Bacteroidetes bacterium]|nr:hypothetical protein [Bacteroidota bacterium]
MTRQKQINFIKRHDSFYQFVDFAGHNDEQLRKVALSVDSKLQADRQKKKSSRSIGSTTSQTRTTNKKKK